jgi:hypothetical protein
MYIAISRFFHKVIFGGIDSNLKSTWIGRSQSVGSVVNHLVPNLMHSWWRLNMQNKWVVLHNDEWQT